MFSFNQSLTNYYIEKKKNYSERGKSLLKKFLSFLKKPYYIEEFDKKKVRLKFWDMFRLLSASLIIALIIGIIIAFALIAFGYDTSDHALSDSRWQSPFYLFFYGVIFAPIIEEMAFRMGLKFSPFKLSFSLALITFFLYPTFFSLFGLNLSKNLLTFMPLLILLFIGILLGFVFKLINNNNYIERFYRKYFFIIFYFFAVLFAGIHLLNYKNFEQIWFLAPLLVAPQFIGGLTMGFVRIKYGLHWSILQHSIWNGFLFTPSFFIRYIDSLDFKSISNFQIAVVSLSAVTLIGIALAVLLSAIFLLIGYVKKDL